MGRGVFITIEGCEGAGKSTQTRMLAERLSSLGARVLTLHEPGGTHAGERVRELLLDAGHDLAPISELLLFEAARAQLVHEVIKPALAQGVVVVCDRFYDSTTAYQGFGRGMDTACVSRLNRFAADGLAPDRTVLIDCDVAVGLARARQATGAGGDRLEREDLAFHERVHEGFARLAAAEPERFVVVGQREDPARTADAVWSAVADLVERAGADKAAARREARA